MPTRILGNPGAFSGESTRNFNGNPSIVRIRPEQSHSRYTTTGWIHTNLLAAMQSLTAQWVKTLCVAALVIAR